MTSKGIGIYPKKIFKKKRNNLISKNELFFSNLHKIGYRYLDTKLKKKIIKNFQRRYRQKKIIGILDQETLKISEFLTKN